MSPAFDVRYAESARDDLLHLFDYLLEHAESAEDFDAAQRAIDTVREAIERSLGRAPFVYRKSGDSPFLRELVIPFGGSGFVALYEIENAVHVTVLAVRHQLEDDYH